MLYNYLTMPRRASPRWFHEGAAVFLETWMGGGLGRAQGPYDEMVFRAMVRDSVRFYDPLGIESAIVDCTGASPVLLRPGVVTREQLERTLGMPLRDPDGDSPRAPGTLESHYAPRAALRLMSSEEMKTALQVLPATIKGLAVYSRTAPRRHPLVQVMPNDPRAEIGRASGRERV